MLSRRRILGLAVESRSATAVELVPLNGGAEAHRAGLFVFPEGLSLAEPQKLGRALRQFLREQGFTASRCVIGLDARCLTARDKTLPPGVGNQVRQVLTLAVEREFASDLKELAVDYAPAEIVNGQAQSALLVAAPKTTIEQLVAMAQAAGLKAEAVTSSTLALAAGIKPAALPDRDEKLVLRVFGAGAELLTDVQGTRTMRPLAGAASDQAEAPQGGLGRLIGELRRVIMLLPPLPAGQKRELLIWNEARLDDAAGKSIAETLRVNVRLEAVPDGVHTNGLAARARAGQFCAASAIALAALRGRELPVDFLHSRLGAARKPLLTRKVAWAAAIAAAALVALGMLIWDWQQDRAEIADLSRTAAELKPQVEKAKAVIDRTKLARTWHDRRPEHLECMKELAEAFPVEGRVWARSVTIQPDLDKTRAASAQPGGTRENTKLSVTVTGFALDRDAVLGVLDRLRANPRMANVQSEGLRSTGKGGREESFSMSFTFDAAE